MDNHCKAMVLDLLALDREGSGNRLSRVLRAKIIVFCMMTGFGKSASLEWMRFKKEKSLSSFPVFCS